MSKSTLKYGTSSLAQNSATVIEPDRKKTPIVFECHRSRSCEFKNETKIVGAVLSKREVVNKLAGNYKLFMSKLKNALTITVGLAVAVMMVGVVSAPEQAEALTADQLTDVLTAAGVEQSVIDAVIAAMDTEAAPVDGLTEMTSGMEANMGPGSTGEGVRELQVWLNDNGYTVAESGAGSPGNESTYYGSRTQSAVGAFQDDHGVSYGAHRGYWGPASRSAARAGVGVAPVTPPDEDPDTVSASLSADRETIEEGESVTLTWESENAVSCEGDGFDTDEDTAGEVEVSPEEDTTYTVTCEDEDGDTADASVTIEVTEPTEPGLEGDEGYMEVTDMSVSSELIDLGDDAVIYEFEVEAIDSDLSIGRMDLRFTEHRPWLYFDEVRLMMDGVEIASLAGTSGNFRETGDEWRARFTGLDQVLREGDTAEFAVEVSTPSSLAGDRDELQPGIYLPQDGIRAIDGAGFLQYAPDTDLDETVVSFDERFGEGDLRLTIGDNSPEGATYTVDEDSRTYDELLLEVDARASSASDINVEDVIVNATTSDEDLDQVIYRARLYVDGSRVRTVAPGSDRIVFDDVDRVISAGDTSTFEVEVDFRRSTGYTTPLELWVDDVEFIAEDQDFENQNETISVDETHDVVDEGLVATPINVSANRIEIGDDIEGEYVFEFELEAEGDTFYLSRDTATSVSYSLDGAGAQDNNNVHLSQLTSTNAHETSAGNFRIRDGETRRFTVTKEVERIDSGRGALEMTLESLHYSDEDGGVMNDLTLTLGGRDWRTSQISLRSQ